MSSRYIARKYGDSRPTSRASMARSVDSRPPSRGASVVSSRGPSPTPAYYANYSSANGNYSSANGNYSSNSGRSSPVSPYGSRATTPANFNSTSRKLRERSIPPPEPLPVRFEASKPPPIPGRGGKPPLGPSSNYSPRVVASDFYKGKVKSIYEREALFTDYCRTLPDRFGPINIYNSGTLNNIKHDFKNMVEDKWQRMQRKDPSVEMNFGAKVYPWRDLQVKPAEPASSRIFRDQASRPRATTPSSLPRIYVYHRSTMSPAPN